MGGRIDKRSRIRKLIPDFENRRWYLPEEIKYTTVKGERTELVQQFIDDELMGFPQVMRHDDMLDALARIYEPDLHASFPTTELLLHRVGHSYKDELTGGFDIDNYDTW